MGGGRCHRQLSCRTPITAVGTGDVACNAADPVATTKATTVYTATVHASTSTAAPATATVVMPATAEISLASDISTCLAIVWLPRDRPERRRGVEAEKLANRFAHTGPGCSSCWWKKKTWYKPKSTITHRANLWLGSLPARRASFWTNQCCIQKHERPSMSQSEATPWTIDLEN